MEASPAPAPRLIFGLAIFSIVSGAALLIFGLSFLKSAYTSLGWPTVQGDVAAVNINRDRVTDSRPPAYTYTYTVAYTYEVDGNRYQGDRYSLGSGSTASRTYREQQNAIAAAKESYAVGQSIDVYYNPNAPADAVLKPGANIGTFVPLIFGLVLSSSGIGLFRLAQRIAAN
ncbi:MAG: DUF3592 domain-containing protein [Cyanobacteria bacterium]|nr:DUF3592 domain-containing protein [Cyanobacteriota bacterium]